MSKHEELIERLEALAEEAHAYHEGSEFAIKAKEDFRGALEALAQELEGLRKDAERYRWLRQDHFIEGVGMALGVCTEDVSLKHECSHQPICGDALDAAVDAAIDAAKGEPHG